jgi:hypothetical protein
MMPIVNQRPPFVQLFNSVSQRWVLVDTKTGHIVGAQATRYEGVLVYTGFNRAAQDKEPALIHQGPIW